jgi:hypothetical protein
VISNKESISEQKAEQTSTSVCSFALSMSAKSVATFILFFPLQGQRNMLVRIQDSCTPEKAKRGSGWDEMTDVRAQVAEKSEFPAKSTESQSAIKLHPWLPKIASERFQLPHVR